MGRALRGCSVLVAVLFVGCMGYAVFSEIKDAFDMAQRLEAKTPGGLMIEFARTIPRRPGESARPGEYIISDANLQRSLAAHLQGARVGIASVRLLPTSMEIVFANQPGLIGGDARFESEPGARDGQLVLLNPRWTEGQMNYYLGANQLAHAIEKSINEYLVAVKLELVEVQLEGGQMRLMTVRATVSTPTTSQAARVSTMASATSSGRITTEGETADAVRFAFREGV